jgi:uncharacterized protein YmfQ (DUF2313 family)
MSCPENAPAPFVCPTLEQSIAATAALLPRGAAWPANDGGALIDRFLAWLGALVAPPAPNAWPPGFVQAGLVAAIGTVRNYVETQWCALKLEFWCATQTLTTDLWNAEYGLPDPCDPSADLCTRVAAVGGTTCDYFAEVAARAGWSITCQSDRGFCGFQCGAALAGAFTAGGGLAVISITVTVFLNESPSYAGGPAAIQPLAGLMLAGMTLNCAPSINALQCLLERIMPAHVPVTYLTV